MKTLRWFYRLFKSILRGPHAEGYHGDHFRGISSQSDRRLYDKGIVR